MRSHLWIAFAALATGGLVSAPMSPAFAKAMAPGARSAGPSDAEAVARLRGTSGSTEPRANVAARTPGADSTAANQVIFWVLATGDNGGLPFIVIDKAAATVTVFDRHGEMLGVTPALLGITNGDESTPGIGNRALSEMGPEERTTPAGRFPARFGPAIGGHPVLWVDYANSVALHPVITTNPRERRLQRLQSPSPEDNRITYGCINVPARFFANLVRPLFRKTGGIVYILPDARPLENVFPQLRSSRRFRANLSR
jgi:hypothetical protein